MEIFFPEYYHDFRCLAGACPDSCCKEWTVDVDPQSAAYYRSLSGVLGDRLRSVLQDTQNGTVMEIENGRCPMWRQDGLCRIQAELGHDALCKTCRDFPRLRHDYGDFVELGLELSCPEAARLILNAPLKKMSSQIQPGGSAPEYDSECMAILLRSRENVLSFLSNCRYSIPESLAVILIYSHNVQSEIDGAEAVLFKPERCLCDARKFAQTGDLSSLRSLFLNLEIMTSRWHSLLTKPWNTCNWTPQIRAMLQYLIQRYWLQAVSDYDLVCRTKMIVASCILVSALDGNLTETAQLFSKEIENDTDNINALLDSAYECPALTDTNLLSLLLNL